MFVAHRLRTIYDSDQILVLKDGQVAESGNHVELLDQDGLYAELWQGESLPSRHQPRTHRASCFADHVAAAQERSLAQDVDLERNLEERELEELEEGKGKKSTKSQQPPRSS